VRPLARVSHVMDAAIDFSRPEWSTYLEDVSFTRVKCVKCASSQERMLIRYFMNNSAKKIARRYGRLKCA